MILQEYVYLFRAALSGRGILFILLGPSTKSLKNFDDTNQILLRYFKKYNVIPAICNAGAVADRGDDAESNNYTDLASAHSFKVTC